MNVYPATVPTKNSPWLQGDRIIAAFTAFTTFSGRPSDTTPKGSLKFDFRLVYIYIYIYIYYSHPMSQKGKQCCMVMANPMTFFFRGDRVQVRDLLAT